MSALEPYLLRKQAVLAQRQADFQAAPEKAVVKSNALKVFDAKKFPRAEFRSTDVTVTVQTSMLPGKDIVLNATFDGDTFEGVLKIPFVGKVKLKDGRRLA